MANTIELEFADGLYKFALPLARIEELQRKTGVGIGELFGRVMAGCIRVQDDVILAPSAAKFHVIDLVETIRQGLIGGNHGVVNEAEIAVSATVANRLIDGYVLTAPLTDSWSIAASVLGACIVGYEPEDKKKDDSETKAKVTAA